MALFSRNKAADGLRVDDVAFDALRRSPRSGRAARKEGAGDASAPLDPAEAAKSRARHRLIGAVALALAAIVFVPMLFDRAPVPTNDDIALQIPDRDSPFEGRRGVPDTTGTPLKSATELPTAPPAQATVAPSAATSKAAVEASAASPAAAVESKAAEPKAAEKTAAKAAADKPVEVAPRPGAATDDPKALAALAGKSGAAPVPEAAGGKTYAVQVAAYATAARARGMRDQLVAGGLKSYTEPVSTAQGVWTRVRLGPYPSRVAADEARQKLRTMKLDGSVVPL